MKNLSVYTSNLGRDGSMGGLIGSANDSEISGLYAEGKIKGTVHTSKDENYESWISNFGGLIGCADSSHIIDSYADVDISAGDFGVGGVVRGRTNTHRYCHNIERSYVTGKV